MLSNYLQEFRQDLLVFLTCSRNLSCLDVIKNKLEKHFSAKLYCPEGTLQLLSHNFLFLFYQVTSLYQSQKNERLSCRALSKSPELKHNFRIVFGKPRFVQSRTQACILIKRRVLARQFAGGGRCKRFGSAAEMSMKLEGSMTDHFNTFIQQSEFHVTFKRTLKDY